MSSANHDDRLQAYLDAELSADERAALEADLAADPDLRARLDRLRATGDLARSSARWPQPAGLSERVRTSVARQQVSWWRWLLPRGGASRLILAYGGVTTFLLPALLLGLAPRATRDVYVTVNDKMTMTDGHAPAPMPAPAPALAPASRAVGGGEGRGAGPVPDSAVALNGEMAESVAAKAPATPPAETAPAAPKADADRLDAAAETPRKEPAHVKRERAPADSPTRGLGSRSPDGTPAVAPPEPPTPTDQPLQAGETDDNARLEKYIDYLTRYDPPAKAHRFSPRERYLLQVVDRQGVGVPDADITVRAGQGRTLALRSDSSGQAVCYPEAWGKLAATLDIESAGARRTIQRAPGSHTVRLESSSRAATTGLTLDVAFVVDTTGSMGEEIDRIRDTIGDVAQRLGKLPGQPRLRLGLVLYRDRGDDYVAKPYPFGDVGAFAQHLRDVNADGGGDTPEDVYSALDAAVNKLDWSPRQAVRLAFLVGDAPPQIGYTDRPDTVATTLAGLAKGIKWFAVSTSGDDGGTEDDLREYVWRQIALLSRGRFLFVTKQNPAAPASTRPDWTPHHVARQDYTVQALPDLVVKCVAREWAALGLPPGSEPQFTIPPASQQPKIAPRPQPQPAPELPAPRRELPHLPSWTLALVFVLNTIGWLYAYVRSLR